MRHVRSGELKLWSERLGDPSDSAVVLLMGLGSQGIRWLDEFCRLLVEGGPERYSL